jgi:hypothetical protein
MALRLNHNLRIKSGDYWRILSISNNFENNEVVIHLGLFENELQASIKDDPIHVETITSFKGEDNPFSLKELSKSKNNPKSIGYDAIKTLSYPIDFSVSENC